MKRIRLLKFVTAAAAVALCTMLLVVSSSHRHIAMRHRGLMPVPEQFSASAMYEVGEDAEARKRYEWMRLHDPATGEIPRGIRSKELSFASTLPTKEKFMSLSKSGAVQVYSWTARGPYNVGGRTRAFAIDASNTNTLLAGGVSGGMWRSIDGGTSWSKTMMASSLHSVSCLAQDTRAGKTGTWYYGSGELVGNSSSGGDAPYRGDGVFKSTDGGATWNILASTSTGVPQSFDQTFDYVCNVATNPANAGQDEVYAATIGGLQRSTNGGASWTTVRGGVPSGSRLTDVAVTSTGVVYYAGSALDINGTSWDATNQGIWRSTDGTTWENITPAGFPTAYSRIVIGIAPSDANTAYFFVQGTNGTDGVDQLNSHQLWKLTYVVGTGASWSNRSLNLPNESGSSGNAIIDTQEGYDMVLRVKPDDPNFLVLGAINLYRSTDGFASTTNWKRIGGYSGPTTYASYTNHHCDQHSGMFKPGATTVYYSGNDGGLQSTSNVAATTVAWTPLNNGYVTSQFYTVALDHGTNGDVSIGGGLQDNGTWQTTSASGTAAWTRLFSGDGAYIQFFDGGQYGLVSSQLGTTYLLSSTGYANVNPIRGAGADYQFINPFVIDPNNNSILYMLCGSAVWRNNNLLGIPRTGGGVDSPTSVNWDSLGTTYLNGIIISTIAVSKSPANRLYLGTTDGGIYRINNANTGQPAMTDVYTGKGLPTGNVSCIAIDLTNADKAMTVFSNYEVNSLFYTTNAGASWTNVSGNLEQFPDGTGNGPSCRWAAIVPVGGQTTYFVATSTGLYSTTTLNGTSTVWTQEGASTIGNVVVDMIDARLSDGVVVVGTHGLGIFSTTIATSVLQTSNVIPNRFELLQNYPNPFNPSTTLKYSVAAESDVRLRVYDIQGREVARLFEGRQGAGTYAATWNGTDSRGVPVTSGAYLAVLEAGGKRMTQRMMMVK